MFTARRPMRSLIAASLIMMIAACDSSTPSDAVAGEAPAGAAKAGAVASKDWTQATVATADGGFLMGNPDAKVKIIEFASVSCSHCADFHATSKVPLENYIRTGNVSYEMRTFLLGGPLDPPVSLAVRCQGAAPFFRLTDDIFRTQKTWMQTAFDNQAKLAELEGQPQADQLVGLLRIAGLDSFFAARGLPGAKLKQCMTDTKQIDFLGKIRNDGVNKHGLTGTPTFVLNGETLEGVSSWPALEPKIKAAL
ncbi:thioredoxin domain-containing protein [Sphingoaurantiacus capsulatus]|uniref:Thioredoxin domain-containing protein n=1 Tax=Sphingoaurantiacus capsulatus TaxID=1771310 RepID=A0ABV7XGU6_9SPHN